MKNTNQIVFLQLYLMYVVHLVFRTYFIQNRTLFSTGSTYSLSCNIYLEYIDVI